MDFTFENWDKNEIWNDKILLTVGKTLFYHAEYASAKMCLKYINFETDINSTHTAALIILARISYYMNDIPSMIEYYEKAIDYDYESAGSEMLWYYVSINDIEKIQEIDAKYSITDLDSSHMFISLYKKNKNIDNMMEYYNKDITERKRIYDNLFDENVYTIPHKLIIGTYYAENDNLEVAFEYFNNIITFIDGIYVTTNLTNLTNLTNSSNLSNLSNLSIYDKVFTLNIDDFEKLLSSLEKVYRTFGDKYNYFTFLQRLYDNKYASIYKHVILRYIINYCWQTLDSQNLEKYINSIENEPKMRIIHFLSAKSMFDIIDIDIIAIDDLVYSSPTLTIPHKEALKRDFVMKPLQEICPDWNHL